MYVLYDDKDKFFFLVITENITIATTRTFYRIKEHSVSPVTTPF